MVVRYSACPVVHRTLLDSDTAPELCIFTVVLTGKWWYHLMELPCQQLDLHLLPCSGSAPHPGSPAANVARRPQGVGTQLYIVPTAWGGLKRLVSPGLRLIAGDPDTSCTVTASWSSGTLRLQLGSQIALSLLEGPPCPSLLEAAAGKTGVWLLEDAAGI